MVDPNRAATPYLKVQFSCEKSHEDREDLKYKKMVNISRNSNNSETMLSNPAFWKTSDFSKKFRNQQLNKVDNLEKKREFCDRSIFEYSLNDSGKQITASLNI